jgi:2,3-bisphosphoglycerate-dependent phosphoglycerate mutase
VTSSKKPPNFFVRKVIRSRSGRKEGLFGPSTLSRSSERPAGVLVLVRHGESEFNKQDRFTGLKNPDLTPHGIQEAIKAGRTLHQRGFHCDSAYTSRLKRAQQSLRVILKELRDGSPPIFEEAPLNERDYGVLAGMTRDAARARWGDAKVQSWRRSFDIAPPGGESLQMTADRTLPFFENRIRPVVSDSKNVLIVAHGNSLRSIVMRLDRLTPQQIVNVSFATGTILIYRVNAAGAVVERIEIPASRQE